MNSRFFKFINLFFILLLGMMATWSAGQSTITLEEALQLARKNHAGLESGRLAIEQQNKLAAAGILRPPAQISLSGEEFGFKDGPGIHAVNFQQNFYVPKVGKIQRKLYQSGAMLAQKQLTLTDQELKKRVTNAYNMVLYTGQDVELTKANVILHGDFVKVTTAQLEAGETGKIPGMAAKSRLGQVELDLEYAEERHQISLVLFNQWLRADTIYEVEGALPLPSDLPDDSILPGNPHLQVKQAEIELATIEVQRQQTLLLPQITSGLSLQKGPNTFPLFGYEVGVEMPLFKKAYQGHIEAAEVGVQVEKSAMEARKNEMERTIIELRYRLEHQIHILDYLKEQLLPLVNEQSEVNFKAYREGEIGYLEYLDSLEQVVQVKQQYLTALYEWNTFRIEMEYWIGG